MKRLIALLLSVIMILTGCATSQSQEQPPEIKESSTMDADGTVLWEEDVPEYEALDDNELLGYVEDLVYRETVDALDSEDYFVENVSAVYISKEYLEEVAYNSQSNIYFGYTLSELDELFQGTRYVFTVDENEQTVVQELQEIEDTSTETILKNIAIGSGVILVCVTVSVVSGGAGVSAVSMIFAASAKTGTIMAISSGSIGAVSAGIVRGIETGDFDEAMESAASAGSEGFMWGAFSGAIVGGASKGKTLYGAAKQSSFTMNQYAKIQQETGYPLDVIKQFQTMEQYTICKEAGLTTKMVNGKTALIRNIDLNYVDEYGLTNLQRMQKGNAPLDPTGIPYELHHIGQKGDSTLAVLTRSEHRQGGNHKIWHYVNDVTENPSSQAGWNTTKEEFWIKMAELLGGA